MIIGLLLYPELTQLDLTGPYEVFQRLPDAQIHLVWKSRDPVRAQGGMQIVPTTTLAECPQLDVLCVPGGFGQAAVGADPIVLDWLRTQASGAKFVTAVCTGSLILGAAGLLDGYRATTHWAYVDELAKYGAIYEKARVVVDRDRITGGGVTAGIDFALVLATQLAGETVAKTIQLSLEYDPAPPYCGDPDRADPDVVAALRARYTAKRATRS